MNWFKSLTVSGILLISFFVSPAAFCMENRWETRGVSGGILQEWNRSEYEKLTKQELLRELFALREKIEQLDGGKLIKKKKRGEKPQLSETSETSRFKWIPKYVLSTTGWVLKKGMIEPLGASVEDVLKSRPYRWFVSLAMLSLACKVPGVKPLILESAQLLRGVGIVVFGDALSLAREVIWGTVVPAPEIGTLQAVGEFVFKVLGFD